MEIGLEIWPKLEKPNAFISQFKLKNVTDFEPKKPLKPSPTEK